jgi:hypothetical protein
VVECLRAAGSLPILVRQGRTFARIGDSEYTLDPSNADGFTRLAHAVCVASNRLAGVIDCWTAAPPGATDIDAAARVGLLGPLRFAHALSSQPTLRPLPMLRGTRRGDLRR